MDKTEYRIRSRIAEKMIEMEKLPIQIVDGHIIYRGDLDLSRYLDLFQNESDPKDVAYLSLEGLYPEVARIVACLCEIKETGVKDADEPSLLCEILRLQLIKESAVADKDFKRAADIRDQIKCLEAKLH